MGLTNAARDLIVGKLFATVGPDYDAANSYIGVGDSAATFAATQTNLQAATNKLRKGMTSGYPTQVANVLTFQALYGMTEANWVWNEWGVFNHATAGTMLSRKVESLGTKPSTEAWQITATLTFAAA